VKKPASLPVLTAPRDARAGARLTEAFVQVAAEHVRERGVSERTMVAALSSALGCICVAVARTHGFDIAEFQACVAAHFAHVVEAESRRPVYAIH